MCARARLYPDDGAGALLALEDDAFVVAAADTLYGYLTTPPSNA